MATKGDCEVDLSRSQANAGDEIFDHQCTPCHKKNKNIAALKYCGICLEYMCSDCIDSHNNFTVLSKHVLVDVSQVQVSGNDGQLLSVPTIMCKNHPMKVVDMYCEKDDWAGCSVCIAPHYKSCTDVFYIPEYVKRKCIDVPSNQTFAYISTCINDLDAFKKLQNNLKKDLANEKAACRNAIQTFRVKVNKVVDKLEETSLKELDEAYRKLDENISNQVKKIETIETELTKLRAELGTIHDNESQQFTLVKVSQEIVMESVKLTSSLQTAGNVGFHFDRKTEILDLLQQFESLQTGTFFKDQAADRTPHSQAKSNYSTTQDDTKSSTSEFKCEPELVSSVTKQFGTQSTTDVVPKATQANEVTKSPVDITHKGTSNTNRNFYNVKTKSEHNIKSPNDEETCNVLSVCILDNGCLLLADGSNNALKVLDKDTYNINDYLTLKYSPNRICRVNKNEVAVSLCGGTIQFITLKPKLSIKRDLYFEHECLALVVIDDKLYVCDDNTSVHIYTLCGGHITTIHIRSTSDSKMNFVYNDITFNNDNNIVYICGPAGLTAMGLDGKVIWQQIDSDETHTVGPTDVCCDDRCSLFVSGFVTNNVVLRNQNGEFIEEIVSSSDFMKSPYAICFNMEERKLIATLYKCDKMLVFSF